jgi:hypothetical protein
MSFMYNSYGYCDIEPRRTREETLLNNDTSSIHSLFSEDTIGFLPRLYC